MSILDEELITSLSPEQILHLLQRADARLQKAESNLDTMIKQHADLADTHASTLTRLATTEALVINLQEQLREERGQLTMDAIKSAHAMWMAADTNPGDMLDEYIASNAQRQSFMDMLDAIAKGRKINAIKALRAMTGCGLKEGKDVIEGMMK